MSPFFVGDFDLRVCGNQYHPSSFYVMNGSLIGWNAFAITCKAQYEDPQQAFFMIDLDHTHGRRIMGHFPIRVT